MLVCIGDDRDQKETKGLAVDEVEWMDARALLCVWGTVCCVSHCLEGRNARPFHMHACPDTLTHYVHPGAGHGGWTPGIDGQVSIPGDHFQFCNLIQKVRSPS